MTGALLRLILAQISIHACMTGMRMATPLLALREGYSPAAVGFLLALFALTQVFLSLPAGRYADRHGLRRPMALSVGVASLGTAAAALMPVYPVLCLAALCSGGASGAAIIALQRHVGSQAHDSVTLRKVFSWLATGPAVSNFLGPLAAGLLIDHAGGQAASDTGFRAAFGLLALLPLSAWLWVRSVPEVPPRGVAAERGRGAAWDLLQSQSFRRLLLMNWALSSCWDVHTFVVPILGHERGLSASAIGAILGAFAIAAAAIRVLIPLVSEHLSEWKVVMGAMLGACGLFMVYPLMPNAWAMMACSLLLGMVLGSVQPMVMSMIHQITPAQRQGEALGLRMMAINGSSVVMPVLFGSLGAVVGVSALFWAVGAVVGGAARLPWLLGQQLQAAVPPQAASERATKTD